MDLVSGLMSRAPVLLGLAGTAAAVWAGVQAVQTVREDADAIAAEIGEIMVTERQHREA